ncbi:hypothetical protein [Phyllobacterium sp. P30BS-XVII]|uniref:hypothetical protein n=1 Tax=Phyllobacterium sp. P30BS-XVII TaxID=2587046 RepID=UPI0015FE35BA|nr:hypothetical protein [Phyllobacterium sp. P30BS-XVII]MBA8901177.1 hypothetical protein [Phyllobacterium sp. P30BS-XVII]
MLDKLASVSVIARTGFLAATLCACAVPAYAAGFDKPVLLALSEIKKEELPKAAETAPAKPDDKAPAGATPPAPPPPASDTKPATTPEKPAAPAATPDKKAPEAPAAKEGDAAGTRDNLALPNVPEGSAPPHVEYDVTKLPFPVQKMRELILTAAKSGSLEALRPLIGSGDDVTQLSLADVDGDPIAYLKSLAGDTDGQEILAIAVDILNSGYVHLDAGTPDELYVWPYFFAYPLDKLDAKQRVELFQIVTAGDYDEMKQFGTYVFYRLGITPKGRWRFFVNGD